MYMTHQNTLSRLFVFGLILSLAGGSAVMAVKSADSGTPVEAWSDHVWQSALRGDQSALDRYFAAIPDEELVQDQTARFHDSLARYEQNQRQARKDREEAREKAFQEMREHSEAGDLSKALRSAVEVQTLSDSMDEALKDPEIQAVIAQALQAIPDVEEKGDWLRVQELLYRLRTLYEDTKAYEEYARFDNKLEMVNRRVSLLSRYAPRELHKLRTSVAERLGEEALPEFNPAMAEDWRERVSDINGRMLRQSLRSASRDHIETEGWRPLLEGGLDALRLLGTTNALKESFQSLNDQEKSERWISGIDKEIESITSAKDNELDNWTASRLLDRIVRLNDRSINLPEEVIFREFGDGAMHRLDQFSEVIWPENLRRFRQQTEGNFIGVGILIRHNERREIVVVNPLEGTPAYFAGIKPEDVIVEVDGESTMGWSLNDAVDRITGPEGKRVMLGIRREGQEDILEYDIARERIRILTVRGWWKEGLNDEGEPRWNWFVDEPSRIAYVKITNFNEDTYNDLRQAWNKITEDCTPNGLILDLRFNPGGLLTSAVQVSNMFLRGGGIVSGENKFGVQAWNQQARPGVAEAAGIPTIVLVNKGSASGSEIVAGALQVHGAAVVVGERSYGKGSVQTVHQVANNAALKLTTQYFRLPPAPGKQQGRLVHRRPGAEKWGVDPDIHVTMSPYQVQKSVELRQESEILPGEDKDGPDARERPDINQLLTEGLDPQLEMGLLILQARALGTISEEQRHAALD